MNADMLTNTNAGTPMTAIERAAELGREHGREAGEAWCAQRDGIVLRDFADFYDRDEGYDVAAENWQADAEGPERLPAPDAVALRCSTGRLSHDLGEREDICHYCGKPHGRGVISVYCAAFRAAVAEVVRERCEP